ncbi:restriction endonuclease subunit S [Aerococcaceae bacterium NML190073]|nr:restriction endonuclease subunit S [Aerococcaceae bacterium NML190073]
MVACLPACLPACLIRNGIRLLQHIYGVVTVTLGDICEIVRGNGLQKKDFVESGVPCIHYGQIYTQYGLSTNKTKSFVSPEVASKLKKANTGDIIVATTSENVEDVGKSLVWEGQGEVCIGGHSCVLRTNQLAKYIVYYMQTSIFQKQKEKQVIGTKVIELYPKHLSKIRIPLPPLAEQQRIVDVLDKFDTLVHSLSEGLPKEIEQRQQQYEYYRDKLLDFETYTL